MYDIHIKHPPSVHDSPDGSFSQSKFFVYAYETHKSLLVSVKIRSFILGPKKIHWSLISGYGLYLLIPKSQLMVLEWGLVSIFNVKYINTLVLHYSKSQIFLPFAAV